MSTGVPIYLVSACASAEEFVAAFRRYADKNGLFVPTADPLPVGCKGRFAVALTDGGVMIEGQAEVVSSARTASVMHGRVGMTVRFVEPDEPSKTVLAELERARLAMKPAPLSVPPRPADVPATPRPVPPSPHGRIDAVNALAECVAIGDLAAVGATLPPKAGPRFVVPTIPPMTAAVRARTPSAPPKSNGNHPITRREEAAPTREDIAPPAIGAAPTIQDIAPPVMPTPRATPQPEALRKESEPLVAPKPLADADPLRGHSETMVAQAPVSGFSQTMTAVAPPSPSGPAPMRARGTTAPPPEVTRGTGEREPERVARSAVAMDIAVPRTDTMQGVAPPPAPPPSAVPIAKNGSPSAPTAVASPIVEEDDLADDLLEEVPVAPVPASESAPARRPRVDPMPTMRGPGSDLTKTMRSPPPRPHRVSTGPLPVAKPPTMPPPLPRNPTPSAPIPRAPTPSAPVPVAAAPAASGAVEIAEPTDLTEAPAPAEPAREPRTTSIGVPVGPPGVSVLPAGAADAAPSAGDEPTGGGRIVAPIANDVEATVPTPPAGGLRTPPTIEEATPSGDWTMAPDASVPTILPRKPGGPGGESPLRDRSKPLPSGDWMISLDPQQPDGWTPPAKLDKPQPAAAPKLAKRVEPDVEPTRPTPEIDAEPKVQIDPTLIEPLQPMPALEPLPTPPPDGPQPLAAPPMVAPMAVPMLPGALPGTPPGAYMPGTGPHHAYPANPNQQIALMGFPDPARTSPAGGYPQHRMVTDAGTGFFRDSAAMMTYPSEPHLPVHSSKRQRTIVIITSAAVAVVLGVVIVIALAGGGSSAPSEPPPPGTPEHATVPTPPTPEHAIAPVPVDAGPVVVPQLVDAAPLPDCYADVSSTPPGAEVLIDKTRVIGMTPEKIPLPCDEPIEIIVRKGKFAPVTRTVTPTKEGAKVRVAFVKPTVSVKVSSTPAGATITMNGKNVGVTPTTVRLLAGESSTLTLTKDGFSPEVERIVPKSNGVAVHAVLKKQAKRTR